MRTHQRKATPKLSEGSQTANEFRFLIFGRVHKHSRNKNRITDHQFEKGNSIEPKNGVDWNYTV